MISNKEIKYICSLKQKKNRLLNKEILIEGSKLIIDAIKNKKNIKKIFYCYKDEHFNYIRENSKILNIELLLCSEKDAERISDTKNPQKIFALLSFELPLYLSDNSKISDKIIIIDGISDPGNMGTILRTCSWFGFYNIIMSHNSVDLYNPKTVRSAMGAHFHMNTIYKDNIQNIIKFLKNNKYKIIAAHLDGKDVKELNDNDSKWALILGNEANGLSDYSIESADTLIKIEGQKSMESLNVAEAASIIMHSLYQLK